MWRMTSTGPDFEKRSVAPPTAFQSVLRHPYLFAMLTVIFLGAAILVASKRPTQYQTEVKFAIGGARVTNQELPGYITATNAKAAIVARLLDTTPTLDRISKATGFEPAVVRSAVTATNIPDSPIIRIRATGDNAAMATALSSAAGEALKASLSDLEKAGGQVPELTLAKYLDAYEKFLDADTKTSNANDALDKVNREIADAQAVSNAMRQSQKKAQGILINARLVSAEAQAKSDGLKDLYAQQVRAASSGTDLQTVSTSAFVENTGHQQIQLGLGLGIPFAYGLAALGVWLIEQRKHDRARKHS
jgi:hypothetical protein